MVNSQDIKNLLKSACRDLFGQEVEPQLSRPDEKFGDFSTNVAMQLAKQLDKKPSDIAESIAVKIDGAKVAGPGFINITLPDEAIAKAAIGATKIPKPLKDQEIVAEYSDPNPFKVLHVGHLYTSIVGDAIANLLESAGATVHRVNFGGDVGLHVAKTMYAIIQNLGGELPDKLSNVPKDGRAQWMTARYVEGNDFYEKPEAKITIEALNKQIYSLYEHNDKNSSLAKIYWTTRQWSYDYFDEFYAKIGTQFEKYYPESQTVELGLKAVKENMGKVFEKSEGAVVFKGEVHNMHTRVFINSQGLPTYETKDIGLLLKKWEDYHFDQSVVITGNEIYEYMQVVLKAVEQFAPELVKKTTHVSHGLVKMPGGVKMSSRKGNIVSAEAVLDMADTANKKINQKENFTVALGAVKYSFLKNRIGADMVYNPAESVSLEGNSGPYLQYAHARAKSILKKAGDVKAGKIDNLESDERALARKISEYPDVVAQATGELLPSHVCTYLYELAQAFNRFYEKNRVIGNEREATRLKLVGAYADVLKHGLGLLNIDAPEQV